MARIFRSGRADSWNSPRFHSDESFRTLTHGKIQPMEEPSFFERLFSRR